MENCTTTNLTLIDAALFQTIIYIPVLCLGIPLNITAFWVFCCKLKRWTETRVYMINLTVADSFLLFALPFLIYFTKYNYHRDELCLTIRSIYSTNMPMSILLITLIAIDRYIAIKFPLKAKVLRSPLKSASICGFLWIGLMLYSSFSQPIFDKANQNFCLGKRSLQPNYLTLYVPIFLYFVPLGIVIFCSVQVIRCLKKKMAMNLHETKLIQKAIQIVSVNLCVFIVCFAPFHITLFLRFAVDVAQACSLVPAVTTLMEICVALANCNCCLDAFCYYFAAKEFQEFPPLLPACIARRLHLSKESQPPTDKVTIQTRC